LHFQRGAGQVVSRAVRIPDDEGAAEIGVVLRHLRCSLRSHGSRKSEAGSRKVGRGCAAKSSDFRFQISDFRFLTRSVMWRLSAWRKAETTVFRMGNLSSEEPFRQTALSYHRTQGVGLDLIAYSVGSNVYKANFAADLRAIAAMTRC